MGWGAAVAAVAAVILALLGSASGGCAHTTPAQAQAISVTIDTGLECGARNVITCAVDGNYRAYKDCLAAEVLSCLKAKQASLLAAAGGLLFDLVGVHLAGRVMVAPDAFRAEGSCMQAIDADLVARECPAGKAGRLCVVDAVQWCADHGAEARLGEGAAFRP